MGTYMLVKYYGAQYGRHFGSAVGRVCHDKQIKQSTNHQISSLDVSGEGQSLNRILGII